MHRLKLILLMCSLLTVAGCTTGKSFQPEETTPELSGGSLISFNWDAEAAYDATVSNGFNWTVIPYEDSIEVSDTTRSFESVTEDDTQRVYRLNVGTTANPRYLTMTFNKTTSQ